MYQISLFKISYDLEYLDSWVTTFNDIGVSFTNDYSYTIMTNMTISWILSNTQLVLDTISCSEFELSDSPHKIWPRPDLNNYSSCTPPSSSILSQNSTFSLLVSDSNPKNLLNVWEQCQGVPINQTSLVFILPDIQTNFLNFQPNWVVEIITNEVNQVGDFILSIQNQVKLLSPNMTNFRQIEYIWNDPITFTLKLLNSVPQLQSNLSIIHWFVGDKWPVFLEFTDKENDQIQLNVQSSSNSFNIDQSIEESSLNNYTITWTPTLQDVGSITINLTYFDQFHQLSPQSVQLIIEVINFAYFESILKVQIIYAGQQNIIVIPKIINYANTTINLE